MIQESDRIYTQNPDEKVKTDSNDSTSGYLSDKVDGTTLDIDITNHKIKVKDNTFLPLTGGVLSGTLKINGTTKSDGNFYTGNVDPTNSTRLNYDGYFYATKIYNAVYNDIVDWIETPNEIQIIPGKAYTRNKDYNISFTKYYLDYCIGIASDTYGLSTGRKTGIKQIPIAIAGFVLAYIDQPYPPGTPLVAGQDGILTALKDDDFNLYQHKIIAFYDRPEPKEFWYNIKVNKRHWVKIK